MKMINNDIFKNFKITVRRCYKFRGMYVCETNKGTKIIRISKYSPDQIEMEYRIKAHLIENGFNYLDQLYTNEEGAPYVKYNGLIYVMTDYNKGQTVDFYNKEDIKHAIQMLASLHIAGQGFDNLPKDLRLRKIKNLGEVYDKRHRETIKLRKRIENTSRKTDFEILYLKNSNIYQEYQEKSKEYINPNSYKELIDIAIRNKNIAHGEYTYHNIIKVGQDDTIIKGFEGSAYNVQIIDLIYITRRIMQRNQWDIDLLVTILEEYNKINPISLAEWNIIKGMIIFPERFSKLCNEYYNSRRRWNYNMFDRKFTKILGYKDDYISCVNEILKW